jgi:hypothetical protein
MLACAVLAASVEVQQNMLPLLIKYAYSFLCRQTRYLAPNKYFPNIGLVRNMLLTTMQVHITQMEMLPPIASSNTELLLSDIISFNWGRYGRKK